MGGQSLRLHTFADTDQFARRLAQAAGMRVAHIDVHKFPDGESLVRIHPPAGERAVVVRSLHHPNAKLVETLLAADALRRAGAKHVTLVCPYLPYMRQDTVFTPGEPISQRVIGECLGRTFDCVLTIEPHLHRTPQLADVIPCQVQAISATPVLASWVRRIADPCFVVGPDAESEPWLRTVAQAAQVPWVIGTKERLGDRRVCIHFPTFPPGERAVLIDDIASTGVTLAVAARALYRKGIKAVDALVVHALFTPGSLSRIHAAGIRRLVTCDTIPHETNGMRLAPLVAATLKEMYQ